MRSFKIAALTSVAAVAALAIPATATASVASNASGITSTTITSDMQLVEAVAVEGPASSGYTNVLLSNGATIAFPDANVTALQAALAADVNSASPSASPGGPAAVPDIGGSDTGSCGTSFITLETKSNGSPVRRISGFNSLDEPAISYHWQYTVSGPNFAPYTQNNSGSLAFRTSWETDISSADNYNHGTWHGSVSKSNSYADLSDLVHVCHSLGPNVSGTV